jgi:DNA-binding GntR family transcriptional regulator
MEILEKSSQRFDESIKENHCLTEIAYQALHEAILYGRIEPGAPLRQAELAEEMGISARTLREALSRLAVEGLVVSEPYHTMQVARFTIADQEELYQMRAYLEGLTCEAAASRLTTHDLQRLREIMRLATPGRDAVSMERARKYNREFHWTIINASGKRQFMRILDQIWKTTFIYYFQYETDDCRFQEIEQMDLAAHIGIVEALEARDGQTAKNLLQGHILETLKYQLVQMREHLNRSGQQEDPTTEK